MKSNTTYFNDGTKDSAPQKNMQKLSIFEYSVDKLNNVGSHAMACLKRLGIEKISDLWWHFPCDIKDFKYTEDINLDMLGKHITCKVVTTMHNPPVSKRSPYNVITQVGSSRLDITFFRVTKDYVTQVLPLDQERIVSGKLDIYNGVYKIAHPEHIGYLSTVNHWSGSQPIYPLTYALSNKNIRKYISSALDHAKNIDEWIDNKTLRQTNWPSFYYALETLHNPQNLDDLSPMHPARQRLAYDELLCNQLCLKIVRARQKKAKGRAIEFNGELQQKFLKQFEFELTGDQQKAIDTINKDLRSEHRMLRLLQGDVGSGKTAVAIMTLLAAVEAGAQGAFLAPTEILAKQHFTTLKKYLEPIGIKVACLTGKDKASVAKATKKDLIDGRIDILIGTHALIQGDTEFANLAVAIIDEQHRFGVEQRLKLIEKGDKTDLLLMSATPIPRTLLMASYGDLDLSILAEKPKGRKEIETKVISLGKLDEIIGGIKRKIEQGEKVYWVCPLVEESEVLDFTSVEDRYKELSKHIDPEKIGLVHGKMKPAEKDKIMESFHSGDIKLLIATTVIEVGVHVDDANIMIIEHAERYGLSQLHQLRGRIGRNKNQAICILLYGDNLTATAKARLNIMRSTNDGFLIAEEDLKLRGGGEILGSKQSGLPKFKVANLEFHKDLMVKASRDASIILEHDPNLSTAHGHRLRTLLKVFNSADIVKTINAG